MMNTDLLLAVANTDHGGIDELASNDSLRAWWAQARPDDINAPMGPGTAADLDALSAARGLIRAMALRNNGQDSPVDDALLASVPLTFRLTDRPDLEVTGRASLPRHIFGRVVVEILRGNGDPDWVRFKACPADDCGWVFVDQSRNRSRVWCQMSQCGNRAKGTAFRLRHRDGRGATHSGVRRPTAPR